MTAPAGLRLERLPDEPSPAHAQARQFCLDTIREFYGFEYRRDWHLDLDGLLLPPPGNHYAQAHRGAFWAVRDEDGAIIATAGIRHLAWKPAITALFPGRYQRGEDIASLWRLYVRKNHRGRGVGRWLAALCEAEAVRLGYATLYLHATTDALATLAFWKAVGYDFVGNCETSSHFDKQIGLQAMGHSPEVG